MASISSTAGTNGLVATAGYGTTAITASYGTQTVSGTLTVQAPPLVSITVTPASPAIASGTAIQLHATATYSDNSTQEVTTQVTWSSSNTAVATVSNNSGTQGLATGISSGAVTITATENGVSGTATVTVTAVSGAGAARFVYVVNQSGTISGYITDQATGALAQVPGSPARVSPSQANPLSVVADPTGRFVYAGSYQGIYAFTSDGVSGQLTYSLPCCSGAYYYGYGYKSQNPANIGLAVHPSGNFLYAVENYGRTKWRRTWWMAAMAG